MILSQNFYQLVDTGDARDLELSEGLILIEIEPTTNQGHGVGKTEGMELLKEAFENNYPGGWLLNAKIEFKGGSSHPSYGTYRMILTGDLYRKKE